MSEDESFDSFYSKLNKVIVSKFNLGEKMEDSKIVRKILRSLLESFRAKVMAIKEIKDLDDIKVQELKKSKSLALKTIDERMASHNPSEEDVVDKDVAYLVKNFRKFLKLKNCGKFGDKGKFQSSEKEKKEFRRKDDRDSQSSQEITCFKCNGHGHFKKECPNYFKSKGKAFLCSIDDVVWDAVEVGWTRPKAAKSTWDKIALAAANANRTKKVKDTKLQMLTTRFEELKMSEDESFDSFYSKLNEVVVGKFNFGEKTEDSKVTYELSLPTQKKSKSLALKTIDERVVSHDSPEEGAVDKDVAYLVKNFRKKECPNYLKSKGKVYATTLSDTDSSNSDSEDSCDGEGNYSTFLTIAHVESSDYLGSLVKELGEHSDLEYIGIVEESEAKEDEDTSSLQKSYTLFLEKSESSSSANVTKEVKFVKAKETAVDKPILEKVKTERKKNVNDQRVVNKSRNQSEARFGARGRSLPRSQ
ncbi:uncharacterized protein LOC136069742 [Quercus suber]|uniref:uncharacterized protein LOC136069742 n=1 Tax=Quercus suber TaxID=58331 RepID=UPI0032DEE9B3